MNEVEVGTSSSISSSSAKKPKKPGPVIHLKAPQIKNPEPDTPTAPTTADRLRKIVSLMDEGREPQFVIAGLQMILNHLKGVSGIKVSRKKHKNRR